MSTQTDDIRSLAASIITAANSLIADADAIDANGQPSPTRPTALDCLSGTPTAPAMNPFAEQDLTYYNTRLSQFAAADPSLAGGTILFIGDSITERINAAELDSASLFGYNMGISGDTMRGVLGRLPKYSVIHRAGAVVLLIGINDLVKEGGQYGVTQAIADVKLMWDYIGAKVAGKWLVIKVLPINESIYPNKTITNANIDTVNAYIAQKFSGSSVVTVLDMKSLLVDGTGQLNPSYTDAGDGVHLNSVGIPILTAAIKSALQSMGVQ